MLRIWVTGSPEILFFEPVIGESKSWHAIPNPTLVYFVNKSEKIGIQAKPKKYEAVALCREIFWIDLFTLHALRLDDNCAWSFYFASLFVTQYALWCSLPVVLNGCWCPLHFEFSKDSYVWNEQDSWISFWIFLDSCYRSFHVRTLLFIGKFNQE